MGKTRTLQEWENYPMEKDCKFCKDRYNDKDSLGDLEYYDHDAGWSVSGFKEKQWLYRTCLKCGYQWAIWKLGVPRDA